MQRINHRAILLGKQISSLIEGNDGILDLDQTA